jgi:hypothetical protein
LIRVTRASTNALLERGNAGDARDRLHAQRRAHVLGEEILEWSAEPEAVFLTILHLNNKYFLDGRDANSYANVAWIFGVHDGPWPERPVFGKVRHMNAGASSASSTWAPICAPSMARSVPSAGDPVGGAARC